MLDEEKFENEKKQKEKTKFVARTPMEAQRIKLEKLMSDPSKPVLIPTVKQKKDFSNAIPSFIRNVMGSSAGAGSGEFHVYRHLRRKEYARQKHIQLKSKQETLDDEYQQKLENNRLQSEEKTAKKRAKRLKRKKNFKNKAKVPKVDQPVDESDEEESADEEDESLPVGDEKKNESLPVDDENKDGESNPCNEIPTTNEKIDDPSCSDDCVEKMTCEVDDKNNECGTDTTKEENEETSKNTENEN